MTWLIGTPQWFVDISSTANFTWDQKFHYQAIPLAALAISFVEALAFLERRKKGLGQLASIGGLAAALWCGRIYGPAPWSINYRTGYWPLEASPSQAANEAAVRMIPAGDGVSADYLVVPHLTHRQRIYTFPNPWRNSNYGLEPSDHGDPAGVRWIVMDTSMLNPDDRALYESIKASGEFRLVSRRGTIEVLERVRPPGGGDQPINAG